jgi:3-phosphoshikimate 1-carboxyvinyltransferase
LIIITSRPERLYGELTVPGDKSITHRAAMLGAIARGVTEVKGFLNAADCFSTFSCLQSLGVKLSFRSDRLLIEGSNMTFKVADKVLDAGNSGTTARLLLGILAGQPFQTRITGDQSLQQRPMRRVVDPLCRMGAVFTGNMERLPLTIKGGNLRAIDYKSPRASAQVKSALLLAGLYAEGVTTVEEPQQSRDHTELMLAQFGAAIKVENCRVVLQGRPVLRGCQVKVPGDLSTAAFFLVSAALVPDAEVLLKNVGINPTRTGILDVLTRMGADIEVLDKRVWGKEPVANLLIRGGKVLRGTVIEGPIIPRLIDEIPVLAVAAALAEGQTIIRDAAELRVKESDRISALAIQLARLGVKITETEDGMIINGGAKLKGAAVASCGDHRIAMALAVAGLAAEGETAIHNAEAINISYPAFMTQLRSLTLK